MSKPLSRSIPYKEKMPRSRDEALERGLGVYAPGTHCRDGHATLRRTVDTICVNCEKAAQEEKETRRQVRNAKSAGEFSFRRIDDHHAERALKKSLNWLED